MEGRAGTSASLASLDLGFGLRRWLGTHGRHVVVVALVLVSVAAMSRGWTIGLVVLLVASAIVAIEMNRLHTRNRALESRCGALELELDSQAKLAGHERRLTVAVLALDAAHDLGPSIRYFEGLLRRLANEQVRPSEEAEVGMQEIARCRHLQAVLQTVQVSESGVSSVRVLHVVQRALHATRELHPRRSAPVLEISPAVAIRGEPDALAILFLCLLRNARVATRSEGEVGISCRVGPDTLSIDVWNSGPEVPAEVRATMFMRWKTLRPDGGGLGLAVAAMIVRNRSWQMAHLVEDGRTIFRISIPSKDVVHGA